MRLDRIARMASMMAAAGLALAGGAARAADAPTYAKDVAPILQTHCLECHRTGEAAPMSLISYEDTRPWLKAIRKAVVEEKSMPPWHADPSIGHWRNDRRLSEQEIATLTKWIDSGAPMGDPKDLPPAKQFTPGWRIGEPDMVFTMTKDEVLPPSLKDEYRYVMIPTGFTQDRWVKASEVRPGNLAVVHHVIVFISVPGKQTGGDNGFAGGLGGYAPGTPPSIANEGQGFFVPAGAVLVLQMHYNKEEGIEATDRTSIGIQFCDKPVVKQVRNEAIGDMTFVIPPGAEAYESTAQWTAPEDIVVNSILPHMHLRGKDMRVRAKFPDGREQDLLMVPKYDFNWQTAYEFAEPLVAPKGTEFFVKAHFDNSKNNPHNPNPEAEVRWGLPTHAEMMFAFVDYTLAAENLNVTDPGSSAGGAGN